MSTKEKRTTLVHDRFQVCCETCGLVSTHMTRNEAERAAIRHACNQWGIEIWDAMAHKPAQLDPEPDADPNRYEHDNCGDN